MLLCVAAMSEAELAMPLALYPDTSPDKRSVQPRPKMQLQMIQLQPIIKPATTIAMTVMMGRELHQMQMELPAAWSHQSLPLAKAATKDYKMASPAIRRRLQHEEAQFDEHDRAWLDLKTCHFHKPHNLVDGVPARLTSICMEISMQGVGTATDIRDLSKLLPFPRLV